MTKSKLQRKINFKTMIKLNHNMYVWYVMSSIKQFRNTYAFLRVYSSLTVLQYFLVKKSRFLLRRRNLNFDLTLIL